VNDLQASADSLCSFVEWTGDIGLIFCNTCETTSIFTTSGPNISITANFVCQTPTPTFEECEYSLTVNSTGCGAVFEPGEGVFCYSWGEVVELLAVPPPCYGCNFIRWTGDTGTIADVNSSHTNISMYGNYSITAEFTCGSGGTPTPSPTATPGPGDVNGDFRINACDITQCELCILDPIKYPKENYPGWDANEDGYGPNSGDILAVELRILELWPPSP
jgi:hypothetical protein